jgi:hypothetical protein
MGQSSSTKSKIDVNLDNILSKEVFEDLIQCPKKREELHKLVIKTGKIIKVYICPHPKIVNRYYVAEFFTKDLGPPSIGHIVWAFCVYHEHWVYGVNIYEYYENPIKKLVKKNINCYICDLKTRPGYNMSNDFITIFNIIKYNHIIKSFNNSNTNNIDERIIIRSRLINGISRFGELTLEKQLKEKENL